CISVSHASHILFAVSQYAEWHRHFLYDPAPPHIYTLSLHDALPISCNLHAQRALNTVQRARRNRASHHVLVGRDRAAAGRDRRYVRALPCASGGAISNLIDIPRWSMCCLVIPTHGTVCCSAWGAGFREYYG